MRSPTSTTRRSRRAPRQQTPLEVHAEVETTLVELLDELPDSASGLTTLNGPTVREIVVHLAAMESLLAMWLGVPTLAQVTDEGVEERTAAVLDLTREWTFAEVTAARRDVSLVRLRDVDRSRAGDPGLRDVDAHRRHSAVSRSAAGGSVGRGVADDLDMLVNGDRSLGADLVAATPVFASL
jgi:hypothetical protein